MKNSNAVVDLKHIINNKWPNGLSVFTQFSVKFLVREPVGFPCAICIKELSGTN